MKASHGENTFRYPIQGFFLKKICLDPGEGEGVGWIGWWVPGPPSLRGWGVPLGGCVGGSPSLSPGLQKLPDPITQCACDFADQIHPTLAYAQLVPRDDPLGRAIALEIADGIQARAAASYQQQVGGPQNRFPSDRTKRFEIWVEAKCSTSIFLAHFVVFSVALGAMF